MKYYLYQIRNKRNGMIYIGVHCSNKIRDRYMGSGTRIKEAIKKEGIENFEKTILEYFKNIKKMLGRELEIVNEDFIKREDTYNIILGGGKLNTKNKVVVKDKNGIIFLVDKSDERYLNGELVHHNKGISRSFGKVVVKDKSGRMFQIDKNDPRYLSGELVHNMTGFKMNNLQLAKISEASKINQDGKKNSQYGTKWICNLKLKKNKKIKKDALIPTGWILGKRQIKWD